jgi:hypothetical protein
MTVTPLPVHRDMTDDEKRAAARRDLAADPTLTGAAVAVRYKMSPGWGQKQMRAVRDATVDTPAEEGGTTAARGSTDDTVRDATPVTVPVPRHEPEPDVPRHSQAVRLVTIAAVLVVACTAAVISYAHMRHLAIEAGEGWRADILPLSVDGMMVVASMTALARRRAGKGAALAWVALLMGVVASMAANIASAQPTLQGRLMAAWPPLALVVAFELLLQQGRDQ